MQAMIGSSDIACILGLSPWGGPWKVWTRLVGLTDYDSGSTMDTEDGHMLEAGIGARYCREHGLTPGVTFRPGPPITEPSIEGPEPWIGARPDFIRFDATVPEQDRAKFPLADRVVECKAPRERTEAWGEAGTDAVPTHYAIQCMWQMHVIGVDKADLAAYFRYERRARWSVYRLADRPKLREAIVARARDWYEAYVVTRTPPPVDGSASCAEGLGLVYSKPVPKVWRPATAEDMAIAQDLARVRGTIRDLTARKTECENHLRNAIGDAYGLRDGDQDVATWGTVKGRATLNSANVKRLAPDVYEASLQVGEPGRTFRFKLKGDTDDE